MGIIVKDPYRFAETVWNITNQILNVIAILRIVIIFDVWNVVVKQGTVRQQRRQLTISRCVIMVAIQINKEQNLNILQKMSEIQESNLSISRRLDIYL